MPCPSAPTGVEGHELDGLRSEASPGVGEMAVQGMTSSGWPDALRPGTAWADEALALLAQWAERWPLPRVRALHLPPEPSPAGLRGEFCALELDDGALGLSYVLLGDTWAGLRQAAPRLGLAGQPALAVAQACRERDPLRRTVGFAAVNALCRSLFDRAGFVPPASIDSLGHLDPQPGERLGMIGHFTPLIPRIRAAGARLLIVELRADLVGEHDGVAVTTDPGALAGCTKVLATGTLLLNDTLDTMLAHCRQARRVALVGPSVGGPPDPLLARGVSLLGGTWVLDNAAHLAALRAGQPVAGSARKFALTAAQYPGWAALLARL